MLDLMSKVRDYLQGLYGTRSGDLTAGSLFLAFEQFGGEVLASDFKLSPGDAGPNLSVAMERGSRLVDFFAQLDSEGSIQPRADLSPAVSSQYDSLLSAATPEPGTDPTSFLELKGKSRTRFDEQERSLNLAPLWSASLTPQFWFDENDPTPWRNYFYSEGNAMTTSAPKPDPSVSRRLISPAWKWRTVTPVMRPAWDAVVKVQSLHANDAVLADLHNRKLAQLDPAARRVHVLEASRALISPVSARPAVKPDMRIARVVSPAVINRAALRPVAEVANPAASPASPVKPAIMALNPALIRNAALSGVLQELHAAPVTSRAFEVSFDYRVVDIARPWLSAEFLSAPHWYVPGRLSGALSAGDYLQSAGPLTYLPAKFIVTKNLRVRAEWSDEDRVLASGSGVSFGPFSLINKSFENNTLTEPGMKIIAWLCQVAPLLPPISDPALEPTVRSGG